MNTSQLIDDYLDGALDESGAERLRAWMEADPKHVRLFVRHVYLHRQLREWSLAENVGKCLEVGELREESVLAVSPDERRPARRGSWSYGAVACALLGAVAGSWVTWQIAAQRPVAERGGMVAPPAGAAPYVATLVSVTNCRWDQARSTAALASGSSVRSGESLHLLEGVAEMSCALQNGGMASLQLEGPLAMTLSSHGMPSLLYGQLTGSFTCDYDEFTLDTPLGRVVVSGDASLGIIAAAHKVDLHVFSGTATLELWATGVRGGSNQLTAAGGTSLNVHIDTEGNVSVNHGESQESGFMTPAALTASRLPISDEYVATILDAKPVAYWRFERDVDGLMRNEMSDRFHCRMNGNAVRWHPGQDGGSVEFGTTGGPGYLISDDTLDILTDSYTVELWAKPSYFHHGTLFSLLQWHAPQSPIGSHRMVLEICGPISGLTSPFRTTDFHPGRLRFIHECRTRFDVDCFSPDPYSVRHWQHFVAVKALSQMHLYLNGRLVDSKEATGPLPSGLRVLMGQLLPVSPQIEDEVTSRLYSGELDEVAVYDRALADDEIRHHVKLVRPNIKATEEQVIGDPR
ncbi:MAG: LamG-like jellyroll fold domain-containing protein [Pirellulales bacterium]